MTSRAAVEIDGATGEGGGQIVRSALALSLVTGKSCRIRNVRAGRRRTGLLRQHLTAVEAAAAIGAATVEGARPGSGELSFAPRRVRAGAYRFAVGTAGSTTLVLQTVLPALMVADGPSEIVVTGGTHNPHAPPFDFLDRVFLPVVARSGPRVRVRLERPGFYPAGGGVVRATIEPAVRLARLDLLERGEVLARRAVARVSKLPSRIAHRELAVVGEALGWGPECLHAERVGNAAGPGNVLTLEIRSEHVTELFTGFGRKGVPAERVAGGAAHEAGDYLASSAPVGPYLADQLLIPLAMAGGGRFRTLRPTPHTRTNAGIVQRFLDVDIGVRPEGRTTWIVTVTSRSG